jgi:[acyl-carrier-protein] S-malonyltransferase
VSVYACSWIAFQQFKADNPNLCEREMCFAGFSLGEYTALTAAGVIQFQEGLRLVQERAEAMQGAAEKQQGSMMTVIGLGEGVAESLCQRWLDAEKGKTGHDETLGVANYLFPKCQVLSGCSHGIDALESICKQSGAKMCRKLPVSGAFHTALMLSAQAKLKKALDRVPFQEVAATKVFSNVSGAPYKTLGASEVRSVLLDQLVQPVQWERTLAAVVSAFQEGDRICECGPGGQLGAMLRRMVPPPAPVSRAFAHVALDTPKAHATNSQDARDPRTVASVDRVLSSALKVAPSAKGISSPADKDLKKIPDKLVEETKPQVLIRGRFKRSNSYRKPALLEKRLSDSALSLGDVDLD